MNFHLEPIISRVLAERPKNDRAALLVGVSGIDASGKGHFAQALGKELRQKSKRVALIGADGWLDLPSVRFDTSKPAETFYTKALRLDAMFGQLVLPLAEQGSLHLRSDQIEETANTFHTHTYLFENVEIVLVEGIFLFKRQYSALFDLRIWIDSSFDTALKRAVARSQEGLSSEQTVRAYQTIYFPAQRIHFERDQPRSSADLIIDN